MATRKALQVAAFGFAAWVLFTPESARSQTVSTTWSSNDQSEVLVQVGAGAKFKWTNPDGSMIELTGGTNGSMFKLTDHKEKGGSIRVDPGVLNGLQGGSRKALGFPVALDGQILRGTGTFDLQFQGFVEIADVVLVASATLVSNGSDNPLATSLGMPGNQLPGGTISYVTKWRSNDRFTLSNGQELVVGDFYLNSTGAPTVFSYSLSPTTYDSSFTIGERYEFVVDLAAPATGGNLRFALDGTVSKELHGQIAAVLIPVASRLGLALLALILAIVGLALLWRRRRSARANARLGV